MATVAPVTPPSLLMATPVAASVDDFKAVLVASRFLQFLTEDASLPASAHLSSLEDKVTLTAGCYRTLVNQH